MQARERSLIHVTTDQCKRLCGDAGKKFIDTGKKWFGDEGERRFGDTY